MKVDQGAFTLRNIGQSCVSSLGNVVSANLGTFLPVFGATAVHNKPYWLNIFDSGPCKTFPEKSGVVLAASMDTFSWDLVVSDCELISDDGIAS